MLQEILKSYRRTRFFSAENYLADKIEALNKFFSEEGLDSAVVGLSGGIDSAVVYKLLIAASNAPGSPIKHVLGISMPIADCSGVTGQREATDMACLLRTDDPKAGFRVDFLGSATQCYVDQMHDMNVSEWAIGQLASIVRTPHLYFNASILRDEGYKSIVVGTTNRDEGCYIGFFGKASDGMCDLQPIGDIHKSEVVKLAVLLGVPGPIVSRRPVGDVWDGKCDEDMIGCPYWFLELYTLMNDYPKYPGDATDWQLSETDRALFDRWSANIERIHEQNAHKYKVGSPARYVDVMQRNFGKK